VQVWREPGTSKQDTSELDGENRTVRAGLSEQDCQKRKSEQSTRTGQLEQQNQNRTVSTGLPDDKARAVNQDRKARTVQSEQDSRKMTARSWQAEHDQGNIIGRE
jgi:hypothetical protein